MRGSYLLIYVYTKNVSVHSDYIGEDTNEVYCKKIQIWFFKLLKKNMNRKFQHG